MFSLFVSDEALNAVENSKYGEKKLHEICISKLAPLICYLFLANDNMFFFRPMVKEANYL